MTTTTRRPSMQFNLRRQIADRHLLPADRSGIADRTAYWLVSAGIYVAVGVNFYYSGKVKIFDDGAMPASYAHRFRGTIIDSFPGLDASWIILGDVELAVCAALATSLLRREFLPTRTKPFLFIALALAMLTFSLLLFGEKLTNQYDNVALTGYFAATGVMLILVMLMPPYRRPRWLGLGAH